LGPWRLEASIFLQLVSSLCSCSASCQLKFIFYIDSESSSVFSFQQDNYSAIGMASPTFLFSTGAGAFVTLGCHHHVYSLYLVHTRSRFRVASEVVFRSISLLDQSFTNV
jgi:hypothetical protein